MAFSQSNQAKSLVIPAHWQQPRYQFNERVKFLCSAWGWRTGVIYGLEFIAPDDINLTDKNDIGSWQYSISIDENDAHWETLPVDVVHENQLKRVNSKRELVTVGSR